MRHHFAMLFSCALSLGFVVPSINATNCDPISADEMSRAEDARYAAQVNDDFAAMEKMFASDLVYIHSSAVVDNKQSYIESMRSGTVKYKTMRRSDLTFRVFDCVGILNGLGNFDVRVKDQDLSVEVRFHSMWIKRGGVLQFVSWQATRTPQK
jgi:hypothetical protein